MQSHQFTYYSTKDSDFKKTSEEHPEIKEFKLKRDTSFYIMDGIVGYRGKELGSGCYGTVSILHSQDNSDYVVKCIDYGAAPDVKSALTEIKHEAEINKIVYGIGELDIKEEKKIAYLILKKLPLTLQNLYFQKNHCYQFESIHEFLGLYINILKTVHHLHVKHQIVHGDLNPGNICIGETSDEIFCCDFGLARKLFIGPQESEQELTSGLRGSKSWHLAPELKNKILPNPSQDVYSLGKLLYCFKYSLNNIFLNTFEVDYINDLYLLMTKRDPKTRLTLVEAIECFSDLYYFMNPDQFYYSSPSISEEKIEDKHELSEMPEVKNPLKTGDINLHDASEEKFAAIEMPEIKNPTNKLMLKRKKNTLTIQVYDIDKTSDNFVASPKSVGLEKKVLPFDISETKSDLEDFVMSPERKTILQWLYALSKKEKIVLGIGLFLLVVGIVVATAGVALPVLLGVGSVCVGTGLAAVSTFAASRPQFQEWYSKQSRIKKIGIMFGVGLVVAGCLALMSSLAIIAFMGMSVGKALMTVFTSHMITAKTVGGHASVATGLSAGARTAIDLSVGASIIYGGKQLSTTARLQKQGLVGKTKADEKKEIPPLQRSQSMINLYSKEKKNDLSRKEPVIHSFSL